MKIFSSNSYYKIKKIINTKKKQKEFIDINIDYLYGTVPRCCLLNGPEYIKSRQHSRHKIYYQYSKFTKARFRIFYNRIILLDVPNMLKESKSDDCKKVIDIVLNYP